MAEKRGNTGKLNYDFNQAANLEVQINDVWYRVTPREFRSFSGPRRINEAQYIGPTYLFGTNQITTEFPKVGIMFVNDVDPRVKSTKKYYWE